MADKLERDIEMALGMAEKGANVTMNTALQLVIKQRTEEFLFLTLTLRTPIRKNRKILRCTRNQVLGPGVDGYKER